MTSVKEQQAANIATTPRRTPRTAQTQAPVGPRGFTREALDELIALRPFEPAWMRDVRLECWRVLLDTPLPARTDEPWRRTDFSALKFDEIVSVAPVASAEVALKGTPAQMRGVIRAETNSPTPGSAMSR